MRKASFSDKKNEDKKAFVLLHVIAL